MDTLSTKITAAIGPYGIATDSAKEAVLVANTPSFLLDRLRKDIAVQFVLDNMQTPQIVRALEIGLANPPQDATALVPLYVYLVALSSADPRDKGTWKQIEDLDLSRLEWGEVIRNLIRIDAVPTTTMEVTLSAPALP